MAFPPNCSVVPTRPIQSAPSHRRLGPPLLPIILKQPQMHSEVHFLPPPKLAVLFVSLAAASVFALPPTSRKDSTRSSTRAASGAARSSSLGKTTATPTPSSSPNPEAKQLTLSPTRQPPASAPLKSPPRSSPLTAQNLLSRSGNTPGRPTAKSCSSSPMARKSGANTPAATTGSTQPPPRKAAAS
jgi:hypothetical protein